MCNKVMFQSYERRLSDGGTVVSRYVVDLADEFDAKKLKIYLPEGRLVWSETAAEDAVFRMLLERDPYQDLELRRDVVDLYLNNRPWADVKYSPRKTRYVHVNATQMQCGLIFQVVGCSNPADLYVWRRCRR